MATADPAYCSDSQSRKPPAAISIAALLVAWFFIQQLLISHSVLLTSTKQVAVYPETPLQIQSYGTALVSHWSAAHLASNLPGLVLVGWYLESETSPQVVLALFWGSGLLTLWSYAVVYPHLLPKTYLAGSSLGIYGFYGAVIVKTLLERQSARILSVASILLSVGFVLRQIIFLETTGVMPALIHLLGAAFGGCAIVVLRSDESNHI